METTTLGANVCLVPMREGKPFSDGWRIVDKTQTSDTELGVIVCDRDHAGWFKVLGYMWPETANLPTWEMLMSFLRMTFESVTVEGENNGHVG